MIMRFIVIAMILTGCCNPVVVCVDEPDIEANLEYDSGTIEGSRQIPNGEDVRNDRG